MKLSISCRSALLGFGLSLLWSPGGFAQSPKTQAPAAEVDSDGDGLNDANDPHPLLAEMPRLRWRVGSLTVGWNVGQTISSSITELGQDEQNFLKSSKVEFNRSTGLEISGSAGIKGSLTLNPLELKDPGADFSATIGASFSQSDSLSKTDQQQASILQRLIKREDVSSIMSDLHLEFTVHFDNDDQIDYVGKVLKLPVMDPDGNVVVYAQPWGPDGAEPAVRIPRGRGAPIPVNFRARLDTTQSLKLLDSLQANPPDIDLGKTQGSIESADGRIDAISEVASLGRITFPFKVELGDTNLVWRVARVDNRTGKAPQLAAILDAINRKAEVEGTAAGNPADKVVFDRSDSYLRSALGADNRVWPTGWWVLVGPDGAARDVDPRGSVTGAVTLRYQTMLPDDIERFKKFPVNGKDTWLVDVHAALTKPETTAKTNPAAPVVGTGNRTNSLGMQFVPVPGTQVLMSVWETRVRDYRAFRPEANGEPDHPVVEVSWEDARAFAEWLSRKEGKRYRLPTDHEWSLAVGIGDRENATASPEEKDGKIEGVYPWGTQWPPPQGAGNYDASLASDRFDGTAPAGSFAPNQLGLYDLGGNVWEWCEDLYSSSVTNCVLRGGSWFCYDSAYLLSSSRGSVAPTARNDGNGFRVVLEVGSGG